MKKNIYIITFVMCGIIILTTGYFLVKPDLEKRFFNDVNIVNGEESEKILLPGNDICPENHDACIQKINDKIRFSNDITARDHTIETGSGGEKIAVINFPSFSDRTIDEKTKIIQKIKQSGIKILAIGIASKFEDFTPDIRLILKEIPFNDLRIRMYAEPDNLVEVFDSITWKKDPNMQFSLEFYNLDLPTRIRLSDYTYMIYKIIRSNNEGLSISSFSLRFIPLFGEFDGITNSILYPSDGRILKNIPTNKLHIVGIHITEASSPDQTSEYYTSRIRRFLENSSIPNILIDSIASKQNNIINLYGF